MRASSLLCCSVLAAQVAVDPATVAPAALERFAVRVANPAESPVVRVRLDVPDALTVIGVDAPPGWTARQVAPSDSSAAAVEWTGGALPRGEFREFAFFARLGAASRETELILPVELHRADGSVRRWRAGGDGEPPIVRVRGTVSITPGGAFVLAAGSLGLAGLALALALRKPR